MKKMTVTSFLLAACAALPLAAQNHGAPAAYFDAVDKTKTQPSEFMVSVSFVEPDGIAERAGLRAGDFIAGVDGLRARCRPDIVLLRRQAAKNAPDVTLNVIRNRQWVDVTVPNRDSTMTWTSFGRRDGNPKTARRLLGRGVSIETLDGYDIHPVTGEKIPPPSVNDFEEDLKKTGPGVQPWHALSQSNFRMQEALCALVENGGEDDRAWAEGLVRALRFLLLEEYGRATEILAPLLERRTGTFLDEMAGFYAAAARERGMFAETDDWKKLGVDANFFAICYPWPTIPKKRAPGVFAFDTGLQEAYDLLLREPGKTPEAEFKQHADRLVGRAWHDHGGNPALQYRMLVAGALFHSSHGGWPFRASMLSQSPGAAAILKGLREEWEKHPETRNLTAIAMFVPAVRVDDEDALRMAFRHVYDEMGYAEMCVVHDLLRNTHAWFHRYHQHDRADRLARVWNEEARKSHPRVYDWLEARSVVLRLRLQRGFVTAQNLDIRDAANFCQSTPWFIAEPLRDDGAGRALAQVLAPVETFRGLSQKEAAERLKAYVEHFHWLGDAPYFERLDTLMRRVPQDAVYRAMLTLVGEHGGFYAIGGVYQTIPNTLFCTPWTEWLQKADEASFLTARDIAARVRGGENPRAELEAALRKTATPAALLVLARAATDAGETELAQRFTHMAGVFHREGRCVIQEQRHATALWGARAFLMEPGHEAFAKTLLEDDSVERTRAWYLLRACRAYYLEDFEEARTLCEYAKSANAESSRDPGTLIWDGEMVSPDAYAQKLGAAIQAVLPEPQPRPPAVEAAPGW